MIPCKITVSAREVALSATPGAETAITTSDEQWQWYTVLAVTPDLSGGPSSPPLALRHRLVGADVDGDGRGDLLARDGSGTVTLCPGTLGGGVSEDCRPVDGGSGWAGYDLFS